MNRKLLPHELAFGAFLLITWVRLLVVEGPTGSHALTYLGLLAANVVAIVPCPRKASTSRWKLRLIYYPIAMNVAFFGLGPVVDAFHPGRADAFLRGVDQVLLGGNLSLRWQAWTHPALTEFLSLCYLLFFPYLIVTWIYYFRGDLRTLKRLFAGLFTIYGVGFLGYTLLPAIGPYVDMAAQFTVPLEGGVFTRWNAELVRRGTNGVDVFPSLHCAVSSYLLFFDRAHKPWRFRVYFVPCVGLWVATIYLRYHYAIDVLAGFALSAVAYALAKRAVPKEEPAYGLPASL